MEREDAERNTYPRPRVQHFRYNPKSSTSGGPEQVDACEAQIDTMVSLHADSV
jgi:hypothetical protein